MERKLALTAAALLSVASYAWAHHALAAEFDVNKPLKLCGKAVGMEWINPHAWIHLAVPKSDGSTTEWMIECGAPNGLLLRGFTKESLPRGMRSSSPDGRPRTIRFRANSRSITLPDGRTLSLGSSNPRRGRPAKRLHK